MSRWAVKGLDRWRVIIAEVVSLCKRAVEIAAKGGGSSRLHQATRGLYHMAVTVEWIGTHLATMCYDSEVVSRCLLGPPEDDRETWRTDAVGSAAAGQRYPEDPAGASQSCPEDPASQSYPVLLEFSGPSETQTCTVEMTGHGFGRCAFLSTCPTNPCHSTPLPLPVAVASSDTEADRSSDGGDAQALSDSEQPTTTPKRRREG